MAARSRSIGGALAAAALATLISAGAAGRPPVAVCPDRPTPTISPRMPADVCIPDGFTGIALDYFDDYSWRALAALVWPASPAHRGVAASTRGIATPGPRGFETYKPLLEIFHRDGSAPQQSFESYD